MQYVKHVLTQIRKSS